LEVTECFFEWGETGSYGNKVACEGGVIPADSENHEVTAAIAGLVPNGDTYHYRLAAENENGTEYSADQSFSTAHTVTTDPAEVTGPEAAVLKGTVRPEGHEVTECFFEWGLAAHYGYEHTSSCQPAAGAIPPDFNPNSVAAPLSGLQEASRYRFRLVAANSAEGTEEGSEGYFETFGPPQITEVRARDASQNSVTIEAHVNPSGFATTYWLEWGLVPGYGHVVPVSPESIGSGTSPVSVEVVLNGLATGTSDHYRVVAESAGRTTTSPDQEFETLDSCGLSDGRCFELVSPREPGPVAQSGRSTAAVEIHSQAADTAGSLAYVVEVGFPGATKGAEVLYHGERSEGAGWGSSQLSPPVLVRDEQSGNEAFPSEYYALSPDLRCGVLGSSQPLTTNPVAKLIVEAGGNNLYRHNADGSYTLITDLPPEELKAAALNLSGEFKVAGITSDCGQVVFSTKYHYAGLAGEGTERLYEWDEAHGLRTVGWVPNAGGGESAVAASAKNYHAVSEDGERVFFSASRAVGNNAGEVGKTGVFVREDGTTSKDLSLSQTSVPDEGATFQGATADGSRVYFTADAGLTADSSSEGADLYEYDLEVGTLTDLSVSHQVGGAEVAGLIGTSKDGSRIYFAARQQLIPGEGATFAQNGAAETYSVYEESGGTQLKFVGTVDKVDLSGLTTGERFKKTSRVSPDGRYLLFESHADVTGYESGGHPEAYLFDADSSSEATVCISCRQDGKPTVNSGTTTPLSAGGSSNPLNEPRSLIIRNGKPQVFFLSRDLLAQGAAEDEWNLYEWSRGQVFDVATEAPGTSQPKGQHSFEFAGASPEGSDLYLFDAAALNWENPEARPAVWDARVEGGFVEPAPPPAPCDPDSEGACQGRSSQASSSPPAATSSFNGTGNVKLKGKKHRHHQKKKHHKKKGKAKKKAKPGRHANRNRRAGK
jgi:Tol biopolymer transport system component